MVPSIRTHARLLVCAALLCCGRFGYADLAVPTWYDEGAGVSDWHYRIRITPPAGAAVDSTVHVDVDFHQQLQNLGIDPALVDFDETSPRVVRPNGALAQQQEFTDRVYNGALDAGTNGRGEVRFILEDSPAAGNYYLYFDIVENGVKPVAPGVSPINGNFEHSTAGNPDSWVTSAVNANGAQNNEVYLTTLGSTINLAAGCSSNGANGLDTSPNNAGGVTTGQAWHLLGYRDNCEDGTGNERIRISRDVRVPPGAAAGVLEFYFQVQSFDGISNNNNYDWFEFLVDGNTVNHRNLGIDNSTNPTLRIDAARLGRSGYGNNVNDYGWKRARLDLSAWAGSTINFRIQSRASSSDNAYRAWIKLDDVIWSRQDAIADNPEGFGVNTIAPNDTAVTVASIYFTGETLTIQAVVDADPVSATADVYDDDGTLVATGLLLFDDGTHGDVTSGDDIWSNDGSVVAQPSYTIGPADPLGTSWLVRIFARDGSRAQGANSDGIVLRPGQPATPEDQTNYFNIDDQTFTVGGARLEVEKTVTTLQDPTGTGTPKSIPGAWLQYDVKVTNTGPDATDSDSVLLLDNIPAEVALCVSAICTCVGPACTQVDPVEFDESASPVPTGLIYDFATHVSYSLDGVDFSYVPFPDIDGFDDAVRYVRIAPEGLMNAPTAAGDPEFHLRYMVRLE